MKYFLLLIAALFISGCYSGMEMYYELPLEFRKPEKKQEFLNTHSKFLKGKKFFIDPGHGGEDRRSKGPQGLITEADANLHVALALRDFLLEAGAAVEMSRQTDMTVDLKERSYMANRSGADVFISIHHNAPGASGDEYINYTSTYYHARETDYEYEPSEHDLARYIQRDLSYAMRNSGGLSSFDGTYSDYWIYPGAGFSVLRRTEIPAVLVECGFFTNPHEEKRISTAEFNKIQAWGIFRGIARFFAAGVPQVNFVNVDSKFVEGDQSFTFLIDDSAGIDPNSVRVQFDSTDVVDYSFAEDSPNILNVNISDVKAGTHTIRVIAANKRGNHSFPFHKEILVLTNNN